MMSVGKCLKKQSLVFLILITSIYSVSGQAENASLDGGVLTLPVVVVGDILYYVELITIPGTEPTEFSLGNAAQIFDVSTEGATTLSGATLSVPSVDVEGKFYWYDLSLVSETPITLRLSGSGLDPTVQREEAIALYDSNVSKNLVQTRCIACHVDGGVARDSALLFQWPSTSSLLNNFASFEALLNSQDNDSDYILSKVAGNDHTGGIQAAVGSSDYNDLSLFLGLLGNSITSSTASVSSQQFFSKATLKTPEATLRRAAIMLAGRLPTDVEIAAVSSGDVSDLRQVLRGVMDGDAFHQFLLEGANDKLLVRGVRQVNLLGGCTACYPVYINHRISLDLASIEKNGARYDYESQRFYQGSDQGLIESPLELIAYVVENDFPYSEILTADYMMLNPLANLSVAGTANFVNEDDNAEFQPGRMVEVYSPAPGAVYERIPEINSDRVLDPGPLRIDYPHAGVLNTASFLNRYPSTATNRNRARARWTFLNFLDIDIERSAPRTIDPVALADTNNPTMFNENCTVCHILMDPVAGAFQNYGDEGFYREAWGGLDSLDEFYKHPEDGSATSYQNGDTWYRGMRTPGVFVEVAPDAGNSIQWLAGKIVTEPGFGRAAVKFWWPTLMGTSVLKLPEVESDINYQAQLLAYDAQNSTIQTLAGQFIQGGMNLKDLFVEMMMTEWFRLESIDNTSLSEDMRQAHELAEVGSEMLLTPERLQLKTASITGFNWGSDVRWPTDEMITGLGDTYRLYYGGINSASVTKRSTELTPLMSTVAMTHALESACPIVVKEFLLPNEQRRLFDGISDSVTPDNGEAAIRQKLVDLHWKMLGKHFSLDSVEISDAYQLFADSWQERVDQAPEGGGLTWGGEGCEFWRDKFFFDDTEIQNEYSSIVPADRYDGWPSISWDWDVINPYLNSVSYDAQHTKQAWVTVITYLMTHYNYLYE